MDRAAAVVADRHPACDVRSDSTEELPLARDDARFGLVPPGEEQRDPSDWPDQGDHECSRQAFQSRNGYRSGDTAEEPRGQEGTGGQMSDHDPGPFHA